MKSFHFVLTFLMISSASFAQEVDCPPDKDPAKALKEKMVAPSPEFKHRGYISLDEMNEKSSRELAELLVKRIHRECDEVRGAKEGKALEEDSDIMMFVPSGALDGIEKFGFQNQHVTRTTRGADTREGRYQSEIEFPGMILGYSPKTKELLPKYAALDVKKKENIGYVMSPDGYGDVVMVFKPSVKNRTTWTFTDSLGATPFHGSKVTNTLKFKDKETPAFKCEAYCESQIWGSLDFSDVEYAMIKPGAEVPEALKRSGIEVYRTAPSESSVRIKKGELVLAGDSSKLTPVEKSDLTKGENAVVNKIIDNKLFPKMKSSELLNLYSETYDPEAQRVLLGQAVLAKSPESKKFLLDVMTAAEDPISRSQILLGLSAHGDDKDVRKMFLKFLESKINPKPSTYDSGYMGFGMSSGADLLTALAIVADTDGFKDDKELKAILEELVKSNPGLKVWYDRLVLNESLCPSPKGESK